MIKERQFEVTGKKESEEASNWLWMFGDGLKALIPVSAVFVVSNEDDSSIEHTPAAVLLEEARRQAQEQGWVDVQVREIEPAST